MSTLSLTNALAKLELAAQDVAQARAQMEAELAPLLARPRHCQLKQKRETEMRTFQDGLSVMRSGGDLVLVRGTLVRATLALKTLLDEADAYSLPETGESGSVNQRVYCTHPDTLAFFSIVVSRPLSSVHLLIWGHPTRQGKRAYVIEWQFLPSKGTQAIHEHAEHVLRAVDKVATTIDSAKKDILTLENKRKRTEAFEEEWRESKKARIEKPVA